MRSAGRRCGRSSRIDGLLDGAEEIFGRLDPDLGAQFRFMRRRNLLDLESRKGKAPGGYQNSLQEQRVPFIFMNAVGVDGDVRTLLHEGGHAFHMLAARDEPMLEYRHAPLEFCRGRLDGDGAAGDAIPGRVLPGSRRPQPRPTGTVRARRVALPVDRHN